MVNGIIRRAKVYYSICPWGRKLIQKAISSSFYFRMIQLKIKRQIPKDEKGPFNLVIETSSFCNARCLMCPHRLMKRPQRIMTQKIFDQILVRIKKENLPINKVFFSGMGEPLTDPHFLSRLKAVKKLGLPVRLYTNASLLTPQIARQLVDLKLEEVNISFNGATSAQYRKIMGLDFVKTKKNIESLLEARRRRRSRLPFVQISLVVFGKNERGVRKHLANWSGKVDSVTVSRAHEWGGGVKLNIKYQISNIKDQRSKIAYPCRSLWHTFNIDSSGNFVLCCRDYESRYVLGNIATCSFAQIQKSPILKHFRQLHLQYSFSQLPRMCQRCNFPYQGGVEWYLPRSMD